MPIGIDIVKISRMDKPNASRLAGKILSPAERADGEKSAQSLAAAFAAKEAFSKALGTGVRGFSLSEISIFHDSAGKPYFVFSESLKKRLDSMGVICAELSLTHEKEYAAAVVNLRLDSKYDLYKKAVEKFFGNCPEIAITPDMIRKIIRPRKPDMHKGNAGRCAIVAGSAGLTGAAVMSAKAAIRCGAGLITLGCPASLNTVFETVLTEVMTKPLPDTDGIINADAWDKISDLIRKADCVLIGPGLTQSEDIGKILKNTVETSDCPIVIDADGINVLSRNIDILREHKTDIILTPHPGEFSRLTGISTDRLLADREKYASEFAAKYKVTVVFKSHQTVIANSDGKVRVNVLGNPGMACGGSGDVLSGAIASFAAQGMRPCDASAAGVYLHSLAGDMAAADKGEYGMIPTDMIEYLPYAVKYSI